MYKITNIETLGEEYTVTYKNGNVINTVQVLYNTDILSAALGEYNDTFTSITDYLTRSIEQLDGYADIDPSRVYWHITRQKELDLSTIIEHAIKHGYDKIIVEYIGKKDDSVK